MHAPNVIVPLCSLMIVGGLMIDKRPLIAFLILRICLSIVWDSSGILADRQYLEYLDNFHNCPNPVFY